MENPAEGPSTREFLDRDAVIRWEVLREDSLVSRHVLARLLPQAIESSEQLREILDEAKRAMPVLRAIWLIFAELATVLAKLALLITGLFWLAWFLADVFGHPVILAGVAYALAAYFTGNAGYQAMKYLLSTSQTSRQKLARRVKSSGLLAMPLLMYATACPTTTLFTDPALHGPPSMLSWLGFFGYMFADVISLGVPQALLGEIPAFQPPSLVAAANTLWVKSLMTFAVAGTVVSTLVKVIATRHTFVGTVDELTEWLRAKFPGPNQRYIVRPLALERAFAAPDSGVPMQQLRDHAGAVAMFTPPWRVDAQGKFVNPFGEGYDYDTARSGLYKGLQFFSSLYTKFNREEVRASEKAELKTFLSQLLTFLLTVATVFVPCVAILAGWLDYSALEAIALSLLLTVLVLSLSQLVEARYQRLLFLDLLHCKNAATSGSDGRRPSRWPSIQRALFALNRIVFFRSLRDEATTLEEMLERSPAWKRPEHFEILTYSDQSGFWLLHALPFHLQGTMKTAVYQQKGNVLIFSDAKGTQEEFDLLGDEFPKPLGERISTCNKVTLLHCPGGQRPSRPWHVQEVPLSVVLTPHLHPGAEGRRKYSDAIRRKYQSDSPQSL
jgi:hypothetical protein